MKQKLHLSATVENPGMLESIVELLAVRRNDHQFVQKNAAKSWQAIESSSVESYISGTIEIAGKRLRTVHLPFLSSFLFSCTREKDLPYQMRWCCSLS